MLRKEAIACSSRPLCSSRGLRGAFVVLLVTALGCNLFPVVFAPPQDMTAVVGGIANQQPFWGKLLSADGLGREEGEFLLATCGCGDWRALVTPADGSGQVQFPVHFYSSGEYDPATDVTVYGEEGDFALSGVVAQVAGTTNGWMKLRSRTPRFNATRGSNHTDQAEACVLCHVGDDPILPQPENHPAFELNPPNCLSCHQVVIE